jgi:peptide/nickel transport system substrate-binding protein
MRTPRPLRTTASFVLLSTFACVGGDAGSEADAGADATPVRGGSVTIVELADLSKPMPLVSESSLDNEVSSVLYLSLLASIWENGELHYRTSDQDPTALAKSWELFGPDSASLRYHLRTDAHWSDGVPITAQDAAWTLQMQGDPRVASPRQGYNDQIREIVAENDSTLVVHFKRRYPEIFFHTAGNVAPRHLYEGTDPSQLRSHDALNDPAGGKLVVSGPYMIQEWQRGSRVVLVPNPQFQPQPYIERVVFLVLPEETTRIVELQTGNVDVMELPFDKLDMLRQTVPDLRFETRRRRFYDYIAYNPAAHTRLRRSRDPARAGTRDRSGRAHRGAQPG